MNMGMNGVDCLKFQVLISIKFSDFQRIFSAFEYQ